MAWRCRAPDAPVDFHAASDRLRRHLHDLLLVLCFLSHHHGFERALDEGFGLLFRGPFKTLPGKHELGLLRLEPQLLGLQTQ